MHSQISHILFHLKMLDLNARFLWSEIWLSFSFLLERKEFRDGKWIKKIIFSPNIHILFAQFFQKKNI